VKYVQQKELAGSSFFRTLALRDRARKPRRKLEGSALKPLPSTFCGVLRLTHQFIQNHQKASVKYRSLEGKIHLIPWQGVCAFFFYQHCFTKIIDTYIVVMKNMVNNSI
jgi:hypothetical protein